jgi:site-specific DNA-methyltransferase (adenine-specific)
MGFDLSPDYAERGRARLAGIQPGDALDGAPEPLVSAPRTDQGRELKASPGETRRRRKKISAVGHEDES